MIVRLQNIIPSGSHRLLKRFLPWGLSILCLCVVLTTHLSPGQAQSEDAVEQQENEVIQQYPLPQPAPRAPVVQPSRPARPPQAQPRPQAQPQPQARPVSQ
ncbi:MAG: hypothetical protein HC886_19020 [Leptolyngbyaceae cyanobacterium SM1_1_3]|nr:hypothetical protein [Leptolyngbyaceae cyanobacterium SM1_1_3]